ncbi:MAG: hypothetical protein GKR89_11390 [Candidatus Latescibacteria bacterium]|nr:hypothetical protein [Candidatus Latescibacterota bacterium]
MRFAARILSVLAVASAMAAHAQLTTSDPVRAVDNIPPEPATNIRAFDTPNDRGESITVRWSLSVDDGNSFTTFGDAVVVQGGVRGYNLYRRIAGDDSEALMASLGPGQSEYIDTSIEISVTYIYTVRPFDLDNETDPTIEPDSDADLARVAFAVDNLTEPRDADGVRIVSWFDRSDAVIDFNDFFLFADHFGLTADETAYDALYDIAPQSGPDGIVNFDDFFRFAADFGKRVANLELDG